LVHSKLTSTREPAVPRVPQISYDSAPPEVREAHDDHIRRHGRITNMKRTLLNSLPAFRALMEWYPLRDTVQPFLGSRLTVLFAHAISAETECLICSTFFRRILIEEGEDPARLELDERERAVVEFGRRLAVSPFRVPDDVYARVATHFDHTQMTALTAFGAIMVATNVFNNALEVELDEYLHPYRREPAGSGHAG
jgi:alkylhydroperoxidase family enzyme